MSPRFQTLLFAALLAVPGGAAFAQQKDDPKQDQSKPQPKEVEPPEEDESAKPKEYAFNPLQAEKEITVGNYYMKKGHFRAAVARYAEAAKWNPTLADAYLKLGEAEEKNKEPKAAKEAYSKFLALAPDSKMAPEVKKKLGKL